MLKINFNILEIEDGEIPPLFVSANQVHKFIVGPSKKTWANWRYRKVGPRYFKVGEKAYYKIEDLEKYFGANPIQTTGKPG